MILSSEALPTSRKLPSRKVAIPGNRVLASRSHLVVKTRALSPIAFAAQHLMTDLPGINADPMKTQ